MIQGAGLAESRSDYTLTTNYSFNNNNKCCTYKQMPEISS